jgi:hypothetical protein
MNWSEFGRTEFPELAARSALIESRLDLYLRLQDLARAALDSRDDPLVRRIVEFVSRNLRKTSEDEGWLHCTIDFLRPFAKSPRLREALVLRLTKAQFEEFLPLFTQLLSKSELQALRAEYRFAKPART